jgi:hypothetical protein
MLHSLAMNLLFGLLMLGIIVGFNTLTRGIFIPVLSFHTYGKGLLEDFRSNRNLLITYVLLLLLYLTIAGLCVWFRTYLNRNTTFFDVFIICAIPMLVYLAVDEALILIEEARLGTLSKTNNFIMGDPMFIVVLKTVGFFLPYFDSVCRRTTWLANL